MRVSPATSASNIRLPVLGALAVGALAAGEVAAQAIAASHPVFGGVYSPLDGLKSLAQLNGHCVLNPALVHSINPHRALAACATPRSLIDAINQRCLIVGSVAASVVAVWPASHYAADRLREAKKRRGRTFAPAWKRGLASAYRRAIGKPEPLSLILGKSTGALLKLGHEAGIRKGQTVRLVGDDVSQDTLILGGKGAGKTTMGVSPLLLQALEQDCGVIVFDVKANYRATVEKLGAHAGRKVRVIGIGEGAEPFDLLGGVSPEMAATYISAMLLLSGNRAAEATFWNVGAANLSRAVLGLLCFFPKQYSLPALYRYLFVEEYRAYIDAQIAYLRNRLIAAADREPDLEKRAAILADVKKIDSANQEIENFHGRIVEYKIGKGANAQVKRERVGGQTHEIQSGIRSQLSQILAKMVIPEIENAFGTPVEEGAPHTDLKDLLDGAVFVVSAPLQLYGLAAAAIMTFLKLRFFMLMEERRINPTWNQTRRVGLFADEFHEICSCSQEGLSDHKALSVSRDTGAFVVFATQSLDALVAKIGDAVMAKALLANLRQRIYFRNEDRATIEDMLALLGTTEVLREGKSSNKQAFAWFGSSGTSETPTLQPIADASLVRNLEPGEAVALLSIGGRSYDDVIRLEPLYVGEAAFA